jgi:hypothetical protein
MLLILGEFRDVTAMWFGKLFGGRDEAQDTDEPARVAAPPTRAAQQPATTSVDKKKAGSGKGFDPYNSGAFEKRNAWERVSKR